MVDMLGFWKSHADFVHFICGQAFVLILPPCLSLHRQAVGPRLRWLLLALFGLFFGLQEWAHMLAASLGTSFTLESVRAILLGISLLSLAEFARTGMVVLGYPKHSRWVLVLIGLCGLGGVAGPSGILTAMNFYAGVVFGSWAAWVLYRASSFSSVGRRPLRIAALGMLVHALSGFLMAPHSPLFPAMALNDEFFLALFGFSSHAVGALTAVLMGVALWLLALGFVELESDRRTRLLLRYALLGTIAALPLLISGGSIFTHRYSVHVRDELIRVNRQSSIQFQQIISDKMANTDRVVRVMAGSPQLRSAAAGLTGQTLRHANEVLDRYSGWHPACIAYLMNTSGTVIASSNRDAPDSFVGKSYAFRPYFGIGMTGQQGRYFARGITSRERGYYSSYPVDGMDHRLIGVAVLKISYEIEPAMLPWEQPALLVDPHGVIFLSNRTEMTLRSLWPMSTESLQAVAVSQQFGGGPFSPLLAVEPQDGMECRLGGEDYLVFRQPIPMDGWSVVLLSSVRPVAISRLYGIGLSILMCSGLMGLVMLWNITFESTARILASERLFRSVVEAAPYWISLLGRDRECLTVNRSGLRAMDWREEDIIGKPFALAWTEDSQVVVNQAMERALAGNQGAFEAKSYRTDGKNVVWSVVLNPIVEPDGTIRRLVAIGTDVTERRQTEATLRDLGEEYGAIIEAFDGFIYICSQDHEIEFMNRRYMERIGMNAIGRKCFKALHGFEGICPWCVSDRVLKGETVRWEALSPMDNRWYYAVNSPIRRTDGTLSQMAMILDITERKLAEMALQKSEEEYKLLVNNLPATVFKGYPDWTVDFYDDKVEELTGYPKAEFDSRRLSGLDLILKEDVDRRKDGIRKALHGSGQSEMEYRIRHKDGRIIWIHSRDKIILDAKGRIDHIRSVLFDITARKHLEDQLLQSQKMEMVGRLAGGVAHDFNNLLTAIIGYCDLLRKRVGTNQVLLNDIEQIHRAGERAASLTRQLLAFSRKQVLQPKILDLNLVIADMERMLRRLIGEDIDLATVLESNLGRVRADPGQIEQVIMNLAVNARDAMPKGGRLTIETANVELDSAYTQMVVDFKPGPYVMIAVSDTGSGMDEETVARIFEPFFTTKGEGEGTGLGLSTTYGIVKQSGGHIWVKSELGRGTTFRVYLPRESGGGEPAFHDLAVPHTLEEGSETVLLVDDDDMVRALATEILRRCGYTLLAAGHGEEAVRISSAFGGPIDLLVTDVVMPGMSGIELAGRLTASIPSLKVIYITGYTATSLDRAGILKAGVNLLQKPFSPASLAKKVREVLDAAQSS
jgi:PAS domain S-box-containing protein